MPTKQQLESALRNAHNAGDTAAAKKLANALKAGQYDQPETTPTANVETQAVSETRQGIQAITPEAIAQSMTNTDVGGQLSGVANEFASGANRKILGIIDSLGPDRVNDIFQMAGYGRPIEPLQSSLSGSVAPPQGTYSDTPLGRIAGAAGGAGVEGVAGGTVLRGLAATLPAVTNTAGGVLKSMAASAPSVDALYGGIAGGAGQTAKEAGAGEGGQMAASILAPLGAGTAGALFSGMTASVLGRLGAKNIVDSAGLPTKALQTALSKRGVDYGALMGEDVTPLMLKPITHVDDFVDDVIKQQMKAGQPHKYMAGLRVDGGKVVADDLGTEAVKQGFEEGAVASAKLANKPTRQAMRQMLAIQRQNMSNNEMAIDTRPGKVVGNAVMKHFDFIRGKADVLRSRLDAIASKELTMTGRKMIGAGDVPRIKGVDIDSGKIQQSVISELQRLNVEGLEGAASGKVTVGGAEVPLMEAVKMKGFFDGSDIMEDQTSQRIIRKVFNLLSHDPEGGKVDALRAHLVKRQLDSMIDFQKKSSRGLTDAGRNFAKSIRHNLNESIREVSPKYAEINDQLSASIRAMDALDNALPRKVDLYAEGASEAVGQDMRKLLSNYSSRQELNNAVVQLEETAKGLGGQFGVDIKPLVTMANTLDNRFGSSAKTSLRGTMDASNDLNRLRNVGFKEMAIDKGIESIQKLRGINDEKAFNAMQRLITRGE